MIKKTIQIFLCLVVVSCDSGYKTTTQDRADGHCTSRGKTRLVFYNVENLFDTEDDPATLDDEFTPEGTRRWTYTRYKQKLNNLYKVIAAIGCWSPPEIVAFCEIENKKVLQDLTQETPLGQYPYKIIHKDSQDARGIDVGIIYLEGKYKPLQNEWIRVNLPSLQPTRDILYTKGIISGGDTIHIFVNHWPSRRGGVIESEPNRVSAASTLRHKVDSLVKAEGSPLIIITGDFNDEPHDKSLSTVLKASTNAIWNHPADLVNLMSNRSSSDFPGTHKFQGHWGILDQLIVSGAWYQRGSEKSETIHAQVFSPSFLLVEDATQGGLRPSRTFNGFRYTGGYSDHLPIYLDIH